MKAIIVDDEIDAVENLKSLLNLFDQNVQIIDSVHSAQEAISSIEKHKPELVFLDIEMPNGDGFEVLEKVTFKGFQIIFITAFSHYAIKALRMNALDYIMKPIDPDDLEKAIKKAHENNKENRYPALAPLLNGHQKKTFTKLGIPTAKGTKYVDLEDIIRFQASNNYTTVHIKNEKPILISKTLKIFEKMLEDDGFLRIHQSHLVNLKFINEFNRADGSYLLLSNGEKVPVSIAKRSLISKALSIS